MLFAGSAAGHIFVTGRSVALEPALSPTAPPSVQGDDIGNASNGTTWIPTYYTTVRVCEVVGRWRVRGCASGAVASE